MSGGVRSLSDYSEGVEPQAEHRFSLTASEYRDASEGRGDIYTWGTPGNRTQHEVFAEKDEEPLDVTSSHRFLMHGYEGQEVSFTGVMSEAEAERRLQLLVREGDVVVAGIHGAVLSAESAPYTTEDTARELSRIWDEARASSSDTQPTEPTGNSLSSGEFAQAWTQSREK